MKIFSKFKNLSLIKKILCLVLIVVIIAMFAGSGSDDASEPVKNDEETNETSNQENETSNQENETSN